MNAQELKDKYWELYEMMADSNEPEKMKAFGRVMTKMMNNMIAMKPDMAEEYINELESIKWRNYLTPSEAQKIVDGMDPKAPWSREAWQQAMKQYGLPTEEEPYFNLCALWVEMNKEHSDHAKTMAEKVWMKPLNDIPAEAMVKAMYFFALDNLKDKDEVYNIRSYFCL